MAAPKRQEGAEVAPHDELPQVRTLTIGITRDGQAALVWLTSQGLKVLSRELLEVGSPEQVDNAWREEAYRRVWRQEAETSPAAKLATARRVAPATGEDVLTGHGYGLVRKNNAWALYELTHDAERITKQRVIEAEQGFMYMWERFDILTARFLVQQDRRRA